MSENQSIMACRESEPSWQDQVNSTCCVQTGAGTSDLEASLRGRVKMLTCLLDISQVLESHRSDLPALLTEVVRLLPPAWQYPDVCRARLVFDDQEYRSPAFRLSNWKQEADIVVLGQKRGVIEVYYLDQMPDCDEGPFLKVESNLLICVAERVANVVEHEQTEQKLQATLKELRVERAALQQSNVALHSALERVTAERQATQEAIVTNVDNVLMPLLRTLDQELPADKKRYVSLLRDNLREITSPFADKLSRAFMSLTAVEIRICQMIRDGLTTKDIAQTRNVSPATVARQRERIRHKLGLIGTDANLATYLRTFLVERP